METGAAKALFKNLNLGIAVGLTLLGAGICYLNFEIFSTCLCETPVVLI